MDRIPALHRHIKMLKNQALKPGIIESYTVIRHPPAGFGSESYAVALIRLSDGTRCCAQLTNDGYKPQIGAVVEPQMRLIRIMDNGLRVNGLKYRVTATKQEPVLHIQCYVLALSGPSGVGKSTITRRLLKLMGVQSEQVPMITTRNRKKREEEPLVHVSAKKFESLIAAGDIIAVTDTISQGGRCGYLWADIKKLWKNGKLPIVIADIELLKGMAKALGRRAILSCGLLPPGNSRRSKLSTLLHRLRGRGSESEQEIRGRLALAQTELDAFSNYAHLFDHLLINDQLETCLEAIQQIVKRP